MNNTPLLTYALKHNKLVNIYDVESGLPCDCICPNCKTKLIAKKGEIKIHHFAHEANADCGKAYESALHLLAKEVFAETKTLYLPAYKSRLFKIYSEITKEQKKIIFDSVLLEVSIANGSIISDAVGIIGNRKILIEFANTHKIDEIKFGKITRQNFDCIEIDISRCTLNKADFIALFENNLERSVWINNATAESEFKKLFETDNGIIKNAFDNFSLSAKINLKLPKFNFKESNYFNLENWMTFYDLLNDKSNFKTVDIEKILTAKNVEFEHSKISDGYDSLSPHLLLVMKDFRIYIEIGYMIKDASNKLKQRLDATFNEKTAYLHYNITHYNLTTNVVINGLLNSTTNKFWLYHPAINKANKHTKDKKYKIFKDAEIIMGCPNKKVVLQKLKAEYYYNNPIIKQIIDGTYWNLKIYKDRNLDEYIYIGGKQIYLFDTNLPQDIARKNAQIIFVGLKQIENLMNIKVVKCNNCEHLLDTHKFNNQDYYLCGKTNSFKV